MRYDNWDVLLYPGNSKVPIQEFKTDCQVARDVDSPYLINHDLATRARSSGDLTTWGRVPVVTCFIGSLKAGEPMRVSIFSWSPPVPSSITLATMLTGHIVIFEARVLIDGACVATDLFSRDTQWPFILVDDYNGDPLLLRFPSFYPETLTMSLNDANESLGRIKVLITECVSHPGHLRSFQRVRETVVFNFQHVPLNALEDAQIAWPNPYMWFHPLRQPCINPHARKIDQETSTKAKGREDAYLERHVFGPDEQDDNLTPRMASYFPVTPRPATLRATTGISARPRTPGKPAEVQGYSLLEDCEHTPRPQFQHGNFRRYSDVAFASLPYGRAQRTESEQRYPWEELTTNSGHPHIGQFPQAPAQHPLVGRVARENVPGNTRPSIDYGHARSSRDDIPMPDYSSSSSRATSGISGSSLNQRMQRSATTDRMSIDSSDPLRNPKLVHHLLSDLPHDLLYLNADDDLCLSGHQLTRPGILAGALSESTQATSVDLFTSSGLQKPSQIRSHATSGSSMEIDMPSPLPEPAMDSSEVDADLSNMDSSQN
ncbi:hypothetical protein POX_b02097 [Penicillium oxalicum]|uniref:hypothetical protein n=1 Tax=Penicillium oxalicum TaxID=69781 RepID=UPI0020B7543E|nr:hypothetical protein POX_b02097 [Penicillium oxalicum]KAI2792063.1 hypothetical protein POX_b02097 [Penicillium oxalicum]